MDLINQNKFKNWLIILLLLLNIITMSVIWMKTSKEREFAPSKEDKNRPESVSLMKEVLNLDDAQTKQLEKLRSDKLDLSKKYNDSLSVLKKQLSDELFKSKSSQKIINEKTKMIGELQSKVELVRFNHFNQLLAICTPEQKEKLKPIIQELFGRKPPKDELKQKTELIENNRAEEGKTINNKVKENEKLAPPQIDEKVEKYSRRLNLTPDQQQQLRSILNESRMKDENKRMKRMDPADFEKEKEKMRLEEDQKVMQILDERQKAEFEKMQQKRKK